MSRAQTVAAALAVGVACALAVCAGAIALVSTAARILDED